MLLIRQYEEPDFNACRNRLWVQLTEHHREIYDAPHIGGDDPGKDFETHLAAVGPERLWVADVKGTVVGLVGLIVGDTTTEIEPVSEIEPLIVVTDHRGQGIGSALVRFLKDYVSANDLPELVVKPVARNAPMLEFMAKQGFDTMGTVELILRDESSSTKWKFGAEVSGVAFKV